MASEPGVHACYHACSVVWHRTSAARGRAFFLAAHLAFSFAKRSVTELICEKACSRRFGAASSASISCGGAKVPGGGGLSSPRTASAAVMKKPPTAGSFSYFTGSAAIGEQTSWPSVSVNLTDTLRGFGWNTEARPAFGSFPGVEPIHPFAADRGFCAALGPESTTEAWGQPFGVAWPESSPCTGSSNGLLTDCRLPLRGLSPVGISSRLLTDSRPPQAPRPELSSSPPLARVFFLVDFTITTDLGAARGFAGLDR